MRKRTPSEIKAYGDGYSEAYKQFCHLLDKNDKDKAIRKMELFATAVAMTVETATETDFEQTEPQNESESERLDRIDSEIEDAWARIRELTEPKGEDQ